MNIGKKWVLAMDVGGTHVSAGLVSTRGEIKQKREIMSHDPEDEKPLRERMFDLVGELIDRAEEEGIKLEGICAGVPGIVDTEKGVLVAASNLPELFGLPLGPELSEEFDLPVHIENDVNARAVGEMVFGVARGIRNFVLFSIGTDLGGGIVINGRLLRGAHNIAAEYGHMTLEVEGSQCMCGGFGCAREYVSGAGIAERAGEKLSEGSPVLKPADGDPEKVTAKHVFEAARDGDAETGALVVEFSRRFGAVISNVMKVFDPEMVVLAGEIVSKQPQLINDIVHWTRHYYFPVPRLPDFRVSELTKQTAALGPAAAFFTEHGIPAEPEHGTHRHHKKE